jgi:ADP-ribose pyrophosphatase YjhB (NUDIX family)
MLKQFWRGFTSKEVPQVSAVGVIKGDKILFGRRRDNGKYTNPGGHLEIGENPLEAAKRELKEETGIDMPEEKFNYIRTERIKTPAGKDYIIHAFTIRGVLHGTSTKQDPDAEVAKWEWIPQDEISKKDLHSPDNVLLKGLGLQKEAQLNEGIENSDLIKKTYSGRPSATSTNIQEDEDTLMRQHDRVRTRNSL